MSSARPEPRNQAHCGEASSSRNQISLSAPPIGAFTAGEFALDDGDAHAPGGDAFGDVLPCRPRADDNDVHVVAWSGRLCHHVLPVLAS